MFDILVRSGAPAAPPLAELPELAELADDELIEAIQGWDRVASWVAARQLAAIAELARRRPRDDIENGPGGHTDSGDPLVPEVSEFAVDEVAAALRLSRSAAGTRLHAAVELTRLPVTAAALRDGVIDLPKVRAVVDAVTRLDAGTAAAVEAQVLPKAGRWTVGQLRAALAKAVLAADPGGAEQRHEQARDTTRQVTIRPLEDGMAELWATLTADEAVSIYTLVDTAARNGAADGRSMDTRRADALVTAVLAGSTVDVRVDVTVPAGTALGLSDQPGDLPGHGPIPASMARRLAEEGRWRKQATDLQTGAVTDVGRTAYTPTAALADLIRARDRTCRFPGCRQPARRCDLDHIIAWPAGPTTQENLVALCRHHHRLKHQTRWTVHAEHGGRLHWTSPTGHRYQTEPPER